MTTPFVELVRERDELKAQLAAANERAEASIAMLCSAGDKYNREIERIEDADDSTVICPKCGTEFAPADACDNTTYNKAE